MAAYHRGDCDSGSVRIASRKQTASQLKFWIAVLNLDRPQWDSFFKEIAPNSPGLKQAAASALGLSTEDLDFTKPLKTELRSRVVALALNRRHGWKEYRLDDSWSTPAYPVFCYEYQSEWNVGIPLRVFLYEEALSETYRINRDKIIIVVVYFGSSISKRESESRHGRCLEWFTRSIFIDINRVDRNLFDDEDIFDQLILLTRRDSVKIEWFLRAYEMILRVPAREQGALKLALMCAALNKPHIFEVLERTIRMDPYVAQSLDAYAKRRGLEIAALDANSKRREDMVGLLKCLPNVPLEIIKVIEEVPLENYDKLYREITEAVQTNDWASVENFLPTSYGL